MILLNLLFVHQGEDKEDGDMKVELRISLPDDSVTTVTVPKCQRTDDVFKVNKKGMNEHVNVLITLPGACY